MHLSVSVLVLTHCHDVDVVFRCDAGRRVVCDVFGNDLGIRRSSSYSTDSEEGHQTGAECNLP